MAARRRGAADQLRWFAGLITGFGGGLAFAAVPSHWLKFGVLVATVTVFIALRMVITAVQTHRQRTVLTSTYNSATLYHAVSPASPLDQRPYYVPLHALLEEQ